MSDFFTTMIWVHWIGQHAMGLQPWVFSHGSSAMGLQLMLPCEE